MSDVTVNYTPGMRVIIRDEEWMVKKVERNKFGNQALSCVGVSELVRGREADFLDDVDDDIEIVDPCSVKMVADKSQHFRKSKLYLESEWRRLIPTDTDLHVGHRASMDLLPFQLIPANEALKQIKHRILIADAVGLGKTLEAGILLSELIARGKGKRILVVAVKSMLAQFQKELWTHFTIPLVRLDSREIQKIRAKLPTNYNPFSYFDKTIISIDTLKQDMEYRTHLEKAYWDVIVIDEAQNVAERGNRQAQRSKLAQLLATRSDTMIMLSATPHDGRARSFASLINMLDPTAISDPDNYNKEQIAGLYVRRFKKDIQSQIRGACPERRIENIHAQASKAEEVVFDVFSNLKLQMDIQRRGASNSQNRGRLFKTILEKSLFSSPQACLQTIETRLKTLKSKYPNGDMPDIPALEELKNVLLKVDIKNFSRYQKLLELLNSESYGWDKSKSDDRLVIFTERIETMKTLAENLKKDLKLKNDEIECLSGDMADNDIQRIVEDFGIENKPIKVLVASDVASEGLNLHYLSHRMIHFDIPWSLMTFQQRNGRIDRYGQTKRPEIRYLLTDCENSNIKGDQRSLEILVEKEQQVYINLGDPTCLLDENGEDTVFEQAIEEGKTSNEIDDMFTRLLESINKNDTSLTPSTPSDTNVKTINTKTLFDEVSYLSTTLENIESNFRRMTQIRGLEIPYTDEIKARLEALLPEEALPAQTSLRVSSDIKECKDAVIRKMRENMEDKKWTDLQYLWPLHPIITWANEKNSLIFKRNEAPLVDLGERLPSDEFLFIVSGSIPNRKSTPLVDKLIGILFKNGNYQKTLTMEEVLALTNFQDETIPNSARLSQDKLDSANALIPDVIKVAREHLEKEYKNYCSSMETKINEQLDKLSKLEANQKGYQLSIFNDENNSKYKNEIKKIDNIFNEFVTYVKDTLTIENSPYLKVVTGFMGTK